ncbi:MAG: hypothetical protein KJ770_07955, partial [Actinobacteria bacterium]|nr:hypothetical protein [Actinomycetota bacterium]
SIEEHEVDEMIKNAMSIKNIKVTAMTLNVFDCIFSLLFNFNILTFHIKYFIVSSLVYYKLILIFFE